MVRPAETASVMLLVEGPEASPTAHAHEAKFEREREKREREYRVDDAPTLKPASRHRRGQVGTLRGRHTATTYISPRIDTYLVPVTALQGARIARYRHTAHHRP
eukprot:3841783-Prymnesium_polylepis.1